jgi:hypothetical protein
MAVGKAGKNSVIELWDGSAWSVLKSVEADIRRVSCASTIACIAVGANAGDAQSWFVFEFLGSWIVQEKAPAAPLGATESALNGIDCTATVCTAVGSYKLASLYFPLVERWNGTSWSQQSASLPLDPNSSNLMLSVSCASETNCVAVGESGGTPFAEYWNGLLWLTASVPIPAGTSGGKLASVSCLSTSSCIAVGDYFESAGNEKTLAESWNGSSWSIQSTPNPSDAKGYVNFTDVSCPSLSACFAVGYYASNVTSGIPIETKTLAASWNGSTWAIQSSPNVSGKPYDGLFGLSCVSVSFCTAVGGFSESLLGGSLALAEHWNGTEWSLQTVVPPVASDDSATMAEDASANAIDVLANDSEAIAGSREIIAKTNGLHGTVAITGGGTGLTYAPDADYCGSDSFKYTLNGGSTATVSVTVTCVDDPPVAVDDSETVLEDSLPAIIDVLLNDTDVDLGPKQIIARTNGSHGTVAIIGAGTGLTYQPAANYCGPDSFTYTLNGGSTATVSITVTCVDEPPAEEGGGSQGTTTIIQQPGSEASQGPIVNVTPGVGVVSGRRHPRIAIKGAYAFFTLTCKVKEGDCTGTVTITASIPSATLGATTQKLKLVMGKFRIGAGRSVLVRAKLTKQGLDAMKARPTLRGVAGHMAIVDTTNGERGEIDVNLVRRPKASLLPDGAK